MNHSRLTIIVLPYLLAASSICTAATPQSREVYLQTVQPFLKTHCYQCHDARKAQAGLRLDQLGSDFLADRNADVWKEVMDRINLGEMPPKEERQPQPVEFEPVIGWINASLREVELAATNAGGRIPMRRLNRVEYANSVRDLLHMDPQVLAPLVEDLPGDGKAEGYDRLGVALFFDQTQIERTLAAAERIAERAIVDAEPQQGLQRYKFEENPRVSKFRTRAKSRFADTLVEVGPSGFEFINGGVRFVHGYGNRPRGNPWGRLGGTTFDEVITQDGYYRIRIFAGASRGSRDEPISVQALYAASTPVELATEIPIDAPLDAPKVHETVVFLRSGPDGIRRGVNFSFNDITDLIVSTPENNQLDRAVRDARDALRQANTQDGSKAEIAAATRTLEDVQARAAQWKGPLRHYNPKRDYEDPPTIFVDWVEVSGPVLPEWPPQSHKSVLFDDDERQDAAYIREVFARFLPRAYRRPVTDSEIDGVVTFVEQARDKDAGFHDAIRSGLARVLCSPGFLFIQEPTVDAQPRKLTDVELASRLSYFLWSSMPDETLFTLADAGRLHEPSVLMAQVNRMLDDPKAEAFVQEFAGQWLEVREFGSVMPASEYRDNYDADLEQSSRLEAYAFFREVLSQDLPVTSFLDSNFVMINERLARHYGIEGVEGSHIRRVDIEPQHHRGGVLGMAGLMTYLSDGTRTLPVRRAAWVKRQLFGDPPGNPPPDAGEIQPNTTGKNLTVQQRLDLHRHEPTCASCHRTLDPFGLALENYDAIGMWRTKANGEGFRSRNAPELDVSGIFPNGETFESLEDYKAGLLKRKDEFTRNLVKQVLTYALTRPVGYADHQTIDAITETVRQNEYRPRILINEVVRSELFQSR
tara:strand:+ start:209134 stop:211743 length:2610 start_codon:yes stop_codon:yes gene_type:complete